jgi:hypothetical protein
VGLLAYDRAAYDPRMADPPDQMPDPLLGARLKIERARRHLSDLRTEIELYTAKRSIRLETTADADTGLPIVRIRTSASDRPPLRLALIAGDAVHNLRSALDHVAVALANAGTGSDRWTQFPIYADKQRYEGNESRLLRGVSDTYRSRIEALQPYHARGLAGPEYDVLDHRHPIAKNVSIMLVDRLDIADKHNLLLPVVRLSPFRAPKFTGVKRAKGTYPGDWIRIEDGAEFFRVTEMEASTPRNDVVIDAPLAWTIGFGDPQFDADSIWTDYRKGLGTQADLAYAAEHVQAIVDGFMDAFFGQ